ncbi:MAG: protein-disulfide reductase DsbD N-terminal domain-containing protein [Armatimonadetes bacterium]|nr:protein-disulfide reductase DsbD N-terminal domain-containing protein [Armatimonadota bacterium]
MKGLAFGILAVFTVAAAQGPQVTSRIELASKFAKPGQILKGMIFLTVPEGYHAYAPSDEGETYKVAIEAVEKATYKLGKIVYPKGLEKSFLGENHVVYEGTVKIPVEIAIPRRAKTKYAFKLNVKSQICSNDGMCLMPRTDELGGTVTIKAK